MSDGMDATRKLIYDIGMHRGEDTEFYLSRGHRVVGVEANPTLVAGLRAKFASEIASGQLQLVDKAIAATAGHVQFAINDQFSIWGSISETFIEKLTARVKALKVGHPLDPATEIGPLIHERHLAKVCSYFDVAEKDGATIAVGGKPHDGPGGGHYVQPTLVTGATSKMRVAQEEVFGPFLTVIPFKDEKDAIEIANGVQYGLTGYVWTGDMGRALRVADALEAGMIWLNSENVRHLPTPFGGMKSSGIGRDGGDYSFDFYMETKNVAVAYDTHKVPRIG